MNTERLLTLSKTVHSELATSKLIKLLNQLVAQLEQSVNTPNEGNQRNVLNALNSIYETLGNAPSNTLSPGLRGALEELEMVGRTPVISLVGNGLRDTLREVFKSGYTAVQALDELRLLVKAVTDLSTAVGNIEPSFSTIGIGDETLEPGHSVAGMTIPRKQVDSDLRALQKEIHFFSHLLSLIEEVVEGKVGKNRVHSLHASDFGIDVFTTLAVASNLAGIVIGIMKAYETIRGFKQLKAQAEKMGASKAGIDSLQKDGEAVIGKELGKIQIELFRHCKMKDSGRVHELKTGIKFGLNGLANRIDRGFRIEVRTALPEESKGSEQKAAEMIDAFTSIRFEPESEVRLLDLPEEEKKKKAADSGKAPSQSAKPKKANKE